VIWYTHKIENFSDKTSGLLDKFPLPTNFPEETSANGGHKTAESANFIVPVCPLITPIYPITYPPSIQQPISKTQGVYILQNQLPAGNQEGLYPCNTVQPLAILSYMYIIKWQVQRVAVNQICG
jgi:hypothetical protein